MSTSDFVDTLVYGDNLEILQRFITDESVDLVYLDPPFNKNKAYSAIFHDESGRTSDAQLATLEDYWHWGPTPARHYTYLTNGALHGGSVPHGVSALVGALHSAVGPSPMLAYLVEMATRLVELRRVLKPTGSLYLHCDPTASHYLKLLLDALFGPENFRNEFVWQRAPAHVDAHRGGAVHDTILFYTRSDQYVWNKTYQPHTPAYVTTYYRYTDPDGRRFMSADLSGPGHGPPRDFGPDRGEVTPPRGRCWMYDQPGIDHLVAEDRIFWTRNGIPRLKKYLDESLGMPLSDVWTDVQGLRSWHTERLGWPTQKPLALLDRIIASSSNPGDLVLDPFCGCGTAVEAAQQIGRHWIGIDISNLAVEVISRRMALVGTAVTVFDWPTELDGVRRMVEAPGGRHRFEAWALTRLNAQPVRELGGRGADQGIDGRISFTLASGRVETIIVSVKSGHVGSPAIRDLKGTVERERAVMGLLFTLQEPTEPMRKEAATAGYYRIPGAETYPRTWNAQRPLADHYRLVVPHRSGYPPNPPVDRIDFEVQAREIAELIEPGTHVVGHSYGGIIALLAAAIARGRVRSLSVIEPPAFGIARGDRAVEELIERLLQIAAEPEQSPREFLLRFAGIMGSTASLPDPLPPAMVASARATMAERWPWEAEIPFEALRKAAFPKLVFSGAHSEPFDAVCDVLVERLAAERVVIAGRGHGVQRTGEPFNRRLRAFIDAA